MMTDDMDLVRAYATLQSESAFETLVTRHINMVYSVAIRQVGDTHLAQEVTQAVFIILARKAKTLGSRTILSGWLYRTTQYAAADALKTGRRRKAREQEAYMQSLLNEPDTGHWTQIAPLLEPAMAKLGKQDRDAILLRFFEGKDLKQVGIAMGTNEDSARMRVNRAIEKLRGYLTKHGVALPAAALTAAIAANSVQAAPVGLAVTIGTAKGAAVTATVTALVNGTIKTIFMTTIQKTFVTAAILVTAGTGIYEAREASTLRTQVQTLQQQQAPLAEQIQQLQSERDDATNRLASLANELAKAKANNTELLKLRGEVGAMRNQLAELGKLRDENKRLKTAQTSQSVKAPPTDSQTDFKTSSLKFAGYATPEAAIETWVWAMDKKDNKTLIASVIPDLQDLWRKKLAAPISAADLARTNPFIAFHIVSTEAISDTEVTLTLISDFPDGSSTPKQKMKIVKIGTDWKIGGRAED